jgi:hypothetical protein
MRVYHFLNAEYGLDDIRQRRLKIATIEGSNDPFELSSVALDTRERRERWGAFKREMAIRYGILCFSRDWHNPVQWSHYADHHRGLCLGFDVADTLLSGVVYRKTRYKPRLLDDLNEDIARIILTTKFKHWEYEQEVRVFAELKDRDLKTNLYFRSFDDNLSLREVIVGHRSLVGRTDVAAALGDMAAEVSAFRARIAFHSYKIVKQQDPQMWV